jgi:hypothetical protein
VFLVLDAKRRSLDQPSLTTAFVHNLASKLVRDAEAIAIPPGSGYLLEALLLAPRRRNN